MSENPKISIGIPIYFGEIYLEDTLNNILEQSFVDFEIIISDNNPGGAPEKVAELFASENKHIRYIKHAKNKGALANWNSLIEHAKGEYFIYAGGHDLWSEGFLEGLYNTLLDNKDAVVAYAPSYWMEDPLENSKISTGYFDTSGNQLIQRFNTVFWGVEEGLYGLIRLDAIRKTRLQAQIIGSGAVWLSELSFFGQFVVTQGICRYRRKNRSSENRHERLKRYHYTLFHRKKKYWLPYWRYYFYYLSVPFSKRLPFFKRTRIFFSILSGFIRKYGPDMLLDLAWIFRRIIKKY